MSCKLSKINRKIRAAARRICSGDYAAKKSLDQLYKEKEELLKDG